MKKKTDEGCVWSVGGGAPGKTVRFHGRFAGPVFARIGKKAGQRRAFVCRALALFWAGVRSGLVKAETRSGFRGRPGSAGKVECVIRFDAVEKDLVEKLAFALRISQAEAVRRAVEWHLDLAALGLMKAGTKWHHEIPLPCPVSFWFLFEDYGRNLEWVLPLPGDIGDFFRSILPECSTS